VTNVTNFGAFVDIGVHQDGLVHISQLSNQYVKDPRDVVSPGDRVTVRVLEVNLEKNQIALSMKSERKGDAEAGRRHADNADQPKQERRQDRGSNRGPNRRPNREEGPRPAPRSGQNLNPGANQNKDQKRRDDQKKQQKPVKTAFNNPFAQLANWGKDDD
jgi:uncharacterized protein